MGMAGKSWVTVEEEQSQGATCFSAFARPRRGGSGARDLANAVGLDQPARRGGVLARTPVRLWRTAFANGGIEALKASVAQGPAPVNTEAALRVTPLLEAPVADRTNWTSPRLIAEIEAREGVRTTSVPRSVGQTENLCLGRDATAAP